MFSGWLNSTGAFWFYNNIGALYTSIIIVKQESVLKTFIRGYTIYIIIQIVLFKSLRKLKKDVTKEMLHWGLIQTR